MGLGPQEEVGCLEVCRKFLPDRMVLCATRHQCWDGTQLLPSRFCVLSILMSQERYGCLLGGLTYMYAVSWQHLIM